MGNCSNCYWISFIIVCYNIWGNGGKCFIFSFLQKFANNTTCIHDLLPTKHILSLIKILLKLVNRQKNSKKKQPTALTEDMLNELNKNHMGGFDNYGADDLYNMEDVWNEKAYDTKLPKKVGIMKTQEKTLL